MIEINYRDNRKLIELDAYQFYKVYQAIQLHFKGGKYDYYAYNGGTRLNENSFLKAKGKYFYERWARQISNKSDVEMLIASNMYFNNLGFIAQLKDDVLLSMKGYKKSINYFFKESLQIYSGLSPTEIVETSDYELKHNPHIYLILLNIITQGGLFTKYDELYQNDFLWSKEYKVKLTKFQPFVRHFFNMNEELKSELIDILLKQQNTA